MDIHSNPNILLPSANGLCQTQKYHYPSPLSSLVDRYCQPANPACDLSLARFRRVMALTPGSSSSRTRRGFPQHPSYSVVKLHGRTAILPNTHTTQPADLDDYFSSNRRRTMRASEGFYLLTLISTLFCDLIEKFKN